MKYCEAYLMVTQDPILPFKFLVLNTSVSMQAHVDHYFYVFVGLAWNVMLSSVMIHTIIMWLFSNKFVM